jgi:hypothetical membrane protein
MHRMLSRIRIGSFLWASSIQFFIAQVIAALNWATPYSLVTRYISDLGNTACAAYPIGSTIQVCSPWHFVMNASFIVLGVTMASGAVLMVRAFRSGGLSTIGLGLIAVAGFGVLLVGLFPENENIRLHALGAGLNFVCGNLGMVLLGIAGATGAARQGFDLVSAGMGTLGLIGTALFVSEHYSGLGQGGMERVAAYPLTVWLIVAGVRSSRSERW